MRDSRPPLPAIAARGAYCKAQSAAIRVTRCCNSLALRLPTGHRLYQTQVLSLGGVRGFTSDVSAFLKPYPAVLQPKGPGCRLPCAALPSLHREPEGRCRLHRSAMVAQDNGVAGPAAAATQMEGLSMANGSGQMVAVGEARTVLPRPDLSGVKGVDTQTHAIGIIHPPPDIRAIVDKTAQFVARNGECRGPAGFSALTCCAPGAHGALLRRPASCRAGLSFETKILANEEKNVKFNFLRPTDPYHAYYRAKARPQRLCWCPFVQCKRSAHTEYDKPWC